MQVVLVRPNYRSHIITPPLGIGYLASYLNKKGISCRIIDGLKLNLENIELVRRAKKADVVGISVLSFYFLQAIDLAKKLKKAGKIVVVGGPHSTSLPLLTLKETGADFVIQGEGEKVFYRLLKTLEAGQTTKQIKIKGIISSFNPKPSFAPHTKSLSTLPFPDWEQLDPRTYQKAPHGGLIKNFPVAPIITSRGCPYECKFCASPFLWQKRLRFRKPQEVVEEIKYLVQTYKVKEIHIEDDNFTLKKAHAEAICERIIKEGLKISLATPNGIRADKIDEELLKLMKKAGFYYLAFGVESANQKILDNVNKKESLRLIEKAVKLAHKMGFLTQGFFIFGLPGETKETVEETINFAKSLPFDRAQFLLLDILPGTALWQELKFENRVNWNLESFHEVSWQPPTIDTETLKQSQSKAFRQFYLRPRQLLSLLGMFRPEQLVYLYRRIRDYKVFTP